MALAPLAALALAFLALLGLVATSASAEDEVNPDVGAAPHVGAPLDATLVQARGKAREPRS